MAQVGRPSEYKPEYCDMLINHMKEGGSFKSFGAIVFCGEKTLYNWAAQYPEFLQSKIIGEALSAKFYEDMGKMMMAGQLRRVIKEEVVKDADGNPVRNAKGELVWNREYAPTTGNATVWVFTMKNMHKWRDNVNVAVSGDGEGAPIEVKHRIETPEEKMKRLVELNRVLGEIEKGTVLIENLSFDDGRDDQGADSQTPSNGSGNDGGVHHESDAGVSAGVAPRDPLQIP